MLRFTQVLPECLQNRDFCCGYFHIKCKPTVPKGYPMLGNHAVFSNEFTNRMILLFPKCLYCLCDASNQDEFDYISPTIKSLMLTQLECYDIKMTLQSLNHRNRHMIKQFGRLLAVNITFNTINMVPRFPKSRFIRKEGRKQGQYWTVTYAFCFYNLMIPCYQRNLKAIFDIWNEEGLGIKEEAFNCPLYTAWNKTADLGLYLKAGFFATGVIYWDAPKS